MSDITFSEEQQLALLGHAIVNQAVLKSMVAIGIPPALFATKASAQKIYTEMVNFVNTYHRGPTVEELKNGNLRRDEPKIVESILKCIDLSLDLRNKISLQTIYGDVIRWFTGGLVVSEMIEINKIWNKHQQDEAIDRLHELSNKLNHISRHGMTAQMQTSDKWLDYSIANQDTIFERLLYTGINFIDDATCGIRPDDMLIVTSATGIGKTEMLGRMARNVSKKKRVAYFALEAFSGELESRWRFPYVLKNYHEDPNKPKLSTGGTEVDFVAWLNGYYPELKKYNPSDDQLKNDLKNIEMLYKKTSRYGIKELERDILAVSSEVDGIFIDHLHYIDKNGLDENSALQQIVQRLRDINLDIEKPIILAAHLRKAQTKKKERALIPDLEEIHGSGDTSKVSTWILALSQLNGVDEMNVPVKKLGNIGYGKPTLAKLLKSRAGGATRFAYSAMLFFAKSGYHKNYIMGELSEYDTVWNPVQNIPSWAKNAIPMPKN